jgi:hypothetical protein
VRKVYSGYCPNDRGRAYIEKPKKVKCSLNSPRKRNFKNKGGVVDERFQ